MIEEEEKPKKCRNCQFLHCCVVYLTDFKEVIRHRDSVIPGQRSEELLVSFGVVIFLCIYLKDSNIFFPLEMRSILTKAMRAICVYIAGEGSVGRLQRRRKAVPQGGTRERRSIHTRKQNESNVEWKSHPPFPGQDGSKLRTRGHMKTLE